LFLRLEDGLKGFQGDLRDGLPGIIQDLVEDLPGCGRMLNRTMASVAPPPSRWGVSLAGEIV
jgi:hypothetical protein